MKLPPADSCAYRLRFVHVADALPYIRNPNQRPRLCAECGQYHITDTQLWFTGEMCSYCGKRATYPCGSVDAKWCNNYAPNAIPAFGLTFDEIREQKNTQA